VNSRLVARWLTAPLVLACLTVPAASVAPASASACGGTPLEGGLSAVDATSATDAWAVGGYSSGSASGTLILHWDGTAWTQVPSP
jgi:hypothetical protein